MSGKEFEEYSAFLISKHQFEQIKITKDYGDQGIDLITTKNGIQYDFQCKRWKNKVSNKAVQEVHAGIGYYQLDKAVIITNSSFTKSAQELASKLNVELWGRNHLKQMIMQTKKSEDKANKT